MKRRESIEEQASLLLNGLPPLHAGLIKLTTKFLP